MKRIGTYVDSPILAAYNCVMRIFIFCFAAFAVLVFSITGCEKKAARLSEMRLATGNAQGTYYAYGKQLAGIIEKQMNIKVSVLSTAASKANVALLEEDRADFAFVQNDIMTDAHNGTNQFSTLGPQTKFAAVAGLYNEFCHIVSVGEAAEISGLKGKRVSVGEAGSGTAVNAAQILNVFGLSSSDIIESYYGFGDSARLLEEGGLDAFFCTAGVPTPVMETLAANMEARDIKIKLLPIGEARIRLLTETYPYYTAMQVPLGTYGLGETQGVAVRAVLVARIGIAQEDVYEVTKLLAKNMVGIESALQGIPIPFHEGALRYYRESGALR